MFLHDILNSNEDETLSKVFWSQHNEPIKGDWWLTVKDDLELLQLNKFTLEDLKVMKKYKLKKILKENLKKIALNFLLKEKHEKVRKK